VWWWGCFCSSVRTAARVQWRSGTGDSAHNVADAFRVTCAGNRFRYTGLVLFLNLFARFLFVVFDAFDEYVSGTRETTQGPSR
jgi:hypothetical protein